MPEDTIAIKRIRRVGLKSPKSMKDIELQQDKMGKMNKLWKIFKEVYFESKDIEKEVEREKRVFSLAL